MVIVMASRHIVVWNVLVHAVVEVVHSAANSVGWVVVVVVAVVESTSHCWSSRMKGYCYHEVEGKHKVHSILDSGSDCARGYGHGIVIRCHLF